MIHLDKIDESELKDIQEYIQKHPIENNRYRPNVGLGRSQTWGIVSKRSMPPDLSRNSWRHARLHFLLMEFAKKHVKIPFTSIQVNENLQCAEHMDKNNIGLSYIIAFGEFEGGELTVDNYKHNIKYRPLLFDGSKQLHKTECFRGNRYSIVFHTIKVKEGWGVTKSLNDYEAIQQENKWVIKCSDGKILTKKVGLPHTLQGRKKPVKNDWIIAIPSYHRSQSIKTHTLALLESYNIPHDRIKIFVSPPEVETYKQSVPNIEIVPSVIGCIANRDFIRHYFSEGQRIVYMDDDILDISSVCDFSDTHTICETFKAENLGSETYKKQMRLPNLSLFLDYTFSILDKENANLAGLYPIKNGFFVKHRYTTDLRYICGAMYLERNLHEIKLQGMEYSEDFERTCIFYKRDKKVVRMESVMINTPYYKGEGGLVETRTVEKSKEAQELLVSIYPEYLKVIPPTKTKKFWNLKLKNVSN